MVKWYPVPGRNVLDHVIAVRFGRLLAMSKSWKKLEKLANKYIHGAGIMVFEHVVQLIPWHFPWHSMVRTRCFPTVWPDVSVRRFSALRNCDRPWTVDRGPWQCGVAVAGKDFGSVLPRGISVAMGQGISINGLWCFMWYEYTYITYIIYIYIYIYTMWGWFTPPIKLVILVMFYGIGCTSQLIQYNV